MNTTMGLQLLLMAAGAVAVSAVARRKGWPAPLLLVAAGLLVSPLVPGVPLDPNLVLYVFLPPLLYSAALDSSYLRLRDVKRAVALLSVGLVLFTAFGVGAVVHWLVPAISWPVAVAVGAVVAPPDAVAATAIGRRIGLPRQIVTILEGESLLNDATALAASSVGVATLEVGLDFLWASVGGAALGFVVFVLVAKVRRLVTDPLMDTAISLVTPFAAYLLAEELHSSGVIAVVVTGLLLGHKAPVIQTAQSRIAERINWRTIAFLLENTVFLLIGLQARWILEGVADSELEPALIALVCGAALLTTMVLRMVWVFGSRYLLVRPVEGPDSGRLPSWRYSVVLGWAGMRGVVTLAAAFVIPEDTEYREVLLLVAFTVVAGTLFIQGLSLPWVARTLRVPSPDPLDDALARASVLQQASKAGFEELDKTHTEDPHGVLDLIRQRVEQRNFAAWERLSTTAGQESPSDLYARVRLAMIDAERARVLEIRSTGTVPSDVIRDVLTVLDVEESMLDAATDDEDDRDEARNARLVQGDTCDHLDETPPWAPTSAEDGLVCEQCIAADVHWVSLRRCLTCGNVACCDSSPFRHATEHFHESTHPVMQSAQPGETWRWCFVHHLTG